MLREELSIKILAGIADKIPSVDTEIIRNVLDQVLYDYEIAPRERSLMVTAGFKDKVMLLAAGMPINDISNDLGHANIATTLVCAKTDPSKVRTEYQARMAVG